jgi:hypothetical protein
VPCRLAGAAPFEFGERVDTICSEEREHEVSFRSSRASCAHCGTVDGFAEERAAVGARFTPGLKD